MASRSSRPNIAFDTDTIELPADTPATITLDNQDAGVPHNIAIYSDDTLDEVSVRRRDRHRAGHDRLRDPGASPAGDYYFHCDVHPNMSGSVVVSGGAAVAVVVAAAIRPRMAAASRREGSGRRPRSQPKAPPSTSPRSRGPPSTEVTLTFDNRDDAAVAGQHNVSIYDGDTALFQGELISGPATVDYAIPPLEPGTYEFRCDVHPAMIGTVEVT